jgi:hypothetical protein
MHPSQTPTFDRAAAVRALDKALAGEGADLYVPPNSDAASVEASIRAHLCEPLWLTATVEEPGFSFAGVGERLAGYCIAQTQGYWLVYQPNEERFLCFWGTSQDNLGAHGVVGNPLYCWSA